MLRPTSPTIGLSLWLCIAISSLATAQDILLVPPQQTYVDESRGLVLTNVDTRSIDSTARPQYVSYGPGTKLEWLPNDGNDLVGTAHRLVDAATGRELALYFTTLPLVSIESRYEIVDENDVYALFSLTERDGTYIEAGVGIQFRGAFTLLFDKKSMEIEFWSDSTGKDKQDYQLLGMVSDDDWNLQAMYVEPLRIRSKVSSDLWRGMNELPYQDEEPEGVNGARHEYVELFLNGEYRGLYAVGEKVNRKQLKLKKWDDGIRGELYNGADLGPSTTFDERTPYDNTSEYWGGFEYKHPDEEIDWQRLDDFVRFVVEAPEEKFLAGYADYFDIDNAVDYFLFVNVLNGWDNIAKNVFLARYDSDRPYFFVPWDLDNVLAQEWGYQPDNPIGIFDNNRLFRRLVLDCRPGGFSERAATRWNALRRDELSLDTWVEAFRTQHDLLLSNGVYERESLRWEDYRYNPNALVFLENFIHTRMAYLDEVFAQSCGNSVGLTEAGDLDIVLVPNPAQVAFTLESDVDGPFTVELYDALGRRRLTQELDQGAVIDVRDFASGIYHVVVRDERGLTKSLRLIID